MRRPTLRLLSLTLLALAIMMPTQVLARGKNKVVTENFDWKIYQTEHFKIFYYTSAESRLEDVADKAEAAYRRVSDKLQHQVNFKIPYIYFKTHEEFEQTQVFPGFLPRGVEAFTEPFQSRMLMPVDLPPEELYALIVHELTHVFQYDMLYNNRISTIVRASAPTWFTEGMASYVADDENNLDRMVLRDAAINSSFGSLGNFGNFSYVAYRVGHAAFDYIEATYGIEGVRDFLWQYRKNIAGSVSGAIQRAFDIEVEDFDRDFRKYLRKRYIDLLPIKEEPDDFAREIRTKRTITTLSPELSPSGDLFAAIVPIKNDIDLVLISTKDGRIFKNLTKGHTNAYTEINVGAFQGINDLGWNAAGDQIVFAARKEGTMHLFIANVLSGGIDHHISFEESSIRDAQAPIFSKDGGSIYFVGNQNGFYDVFGYDLKTKAIKNLTADDAEDRNPRLSPDGKEILYSSIRDGFFKIFALNMATGEKTQLTSGLGNDIQATYSADMKTIYFSSDRFDDIYNIYELNLESGVKKQYTNVLTGTFSPQERILFDHKEGVEKRQLVFTSFYQGRFRVYRMDKPEDREEYYDVARDNYANVKNYTMSSDLKIDPEKFSDYKLKGNFSISGANVTAGATDDGRFLSQSQIAFSDTLGNHELVIQTYTVSSYEDYYVNYLNRSHRWQWGIEGSSTQSFFVNAALVDGQIEFNEERSYKRNDLRGYLRYPLSTFTRIDVGAGYTDRDWITYIGVDPVTGRYLTAPADFTEPEVFASFSFDTVRYANYGPQHGTSIDLGVDFVSTASTSYNMDFRAYQEMTRRSLLAFRLIGNYSTGDLPDLYTLGGNNLLRGDFGYQQFLGSKRVLSQFEMRFPLLDVVGFPGFAFNNIRGILFIDTGATWFDDDQFNFEFPDSEHFNPDRPDINYLIGSYGFGISMNFIGLDLNWTWSKRTNFEDFPSSSRFNFWIGRNF